MDSSQIPRSFTPGMALTIDRPVTPRSNTQSERQYRSSAGSSLFNHSTGHSAATGQTFGQTKRRFRSSKLRGEYEKPWLEDPRFKRTKYNALIICFLVLLGLAGAAVYGYFEVTKNLAEPVRTRIQAAACLICLSACSQRLNLDVSHLRGRLFEVGS
jgi:hypothetical protein